MHERASGIGPPSRLADLCEPGTENGCACLAGGGLPLEDERHRLPRPLPAVRAASLARAAGLADERDRVRRRLVLPASGSPAVPENRVAAALREREPPLPLELGWLGERGV